MNEPPLKIDCMYECLTKISQRLYRVIGNFLIWKNQDIDDVSKAHMDFVA